MPCWCPAPNDARLKVAAWYLPHRQVGGDITTSSASASEVVVVADVSGKGSGRPADVELPGHAARTAPVHRPLDALMHDLNDKVVTARNERFVTFLGRMDLRTGLMRYVNAGHNGPLLSDGTISELTSGHRAYKSGRIALPPIGQ